MHHGQSLDRGTVPRMRPRKQRKGKSRWYHRSRGEELLRCENYSKDKNRKEAQVWDLRSGCVVSIVRTSALGNYWEREIVTVPPSAASTKSTPDCGKIHAFNMCSIRKMECYWQY